MPYADREKQRKAQAESLRRRYHAEGSTLPAYHYAYTKRRRCADLLQAGPNPSLRATKAGTLRMRPA